MGVLGSSCAEIPANGWCAPALKSANTISVRSALVTRIGMPDMRMEYSYSLPSKNSSGAWGWLVLCKLGSAPCSSNIRSISGVPYIKTRSTGVLSL